MKYCKEARSSNNFNRGKYGEHILLENICVVLDTKRVIQELKVEYTVPLDRTRTHGNDILATATCSISVHNELIWIILDHPKGHGEKSIYWMIKNYPN